MKFEIDLTPSEILEHADRSDRRDFFEELESEFTPDVEDLVDRATNYEKRRIFDKLMDNGYGDELLKNDDESPTTIEEKRYMMDKADDDMLMYLVDKYKYFS